MSELIYIAAAMVVIVVVALGAHIYHWEIYMWMAGIIMLAASSWLNKRS